MHQYSSVPSLSWVGFLWLYWLQHARLLCPSPTPRVYSNSCLLIQWCHPIILSSGEMNTRWSTFPLHWMHSRLSFHMIYNKCLDILYNNPEIPWDTHLKSIGTCLLRLCPLQHPGAVHLRHWCGHRCDPDFPRGVRGNLGQLSSYTYGCEPQAQGRAGKHCNRSYELTTFPQISWETVAAGNQPWGLPQLILLHSAKKSFLGPSQSSAAFNPMRSLGLRL